MPHTCKTILASKTFNKVANPTSNRNTLLTINATGSYKYYKSCIIKRLNRYPRGRSIVIRQCLTYASRF